MASLRAVQLKERFAEEPADRFEPLTFGELKVGDKFIPFPVPGGIDGCGGFRTGSYLFVKTSGFDLENNAFNLSLPGMTEWPLHYLVIKIL